MLTLITTTRSTTESRSTRRVHSIRPPVPGGIEWPKFGRDIFARGEDTDVMILVRIGDPHKHVTRWLTLRLPVRLTYTKRLHHLTAVKNTGSSKHRQKRPPATKAKEQYNRGDDGGAQPSARHLYYMKRYYFKRGKLEVGSGLLILLAVDLWQPLSADEATLVATNTATIG